VVALNFFYNIPVKLYSSLLLICVLFLLVPYVNKLIGFFFQGKFVTLAEKHYKFERVWKKYLLLACAIGIPATLFVNTTIHVGKRYRDNTNITKREKLYEVTCFVTKDTLQPLLTDTVRWRRFAFTDKASAIVYNMQDKADYYDYDMDSIKHTYTLHNGPDTTSWNVFHYSYPQKNMFQLVGNWKGSNVTVLMKEQYIDSMLLNKERIKFLYD